MSPDTSQASLWSNVPKRLIVYWGRNAPMSWMRFMTVKSFLSMNPDWKVDVLTPHSPVMKQSWGSKEFEVKYVGKDWFHALEALPRVEVKWIDFSIVASLLPSEIHRSDYIRYSELASGGVWSDMDVLYLKPVEEVEFSHMPAPDEVEGAVCWSGNRKGKEHHKIGFLIGTEGSRFWQKVFDTAWERIHETVISEYQQLGRGMLDEHFPWEENGRMANVLNRSVYPLRTTILSRLYQDGVPMNAVKKAVGIHWYAGHVRSGQAQKDIVPGDTSLFSQLARRSL